MISNFLTKNIPAQLDRCKQFLLSTTMIWQVNQTESQNPILHPINRCSVQANSKEILCILKFELLMVNNCQYVLIILYVLFFQSLSSSHTMFGQN